MQIDKLPASLLSMQLEIVRNWEQLVAGRQLDHSYAVLNHTGARFRMDDESHRSAVGVVLHFGPSESLPR